MVFRAMNINELSEDMTAHYFPLLTDAKKEKILKMSNFNEKNIAFCSEILARQCLSELCDAPEFSFSLLCNPNSKSAVGNFDAEISISSAGDFIACAASHDYVGVGISPIMPFSFQDAQKNLTDAEIRAVFSESGYSFSDIIKQPLCKEKSAIIKYAVFSSLKDAYFYASGRGIRSDRRNYYFEFEGTSMACSDKSFSVVKSYVDSKENVAVSVIERCKK